MDRENLLKEINFIAHHGGVNAWIRDRLQFLHRAVRKLEQDERERCALVAEHLNGWGSPPAPELAHHIAKTIREMPRGDFKSALGDRNG